MSGQGLAAQLLHHPAPQGTSPASSLTSIDLRPGSPDLCFRCTPLASHRELRKGCPSFPLHHPGELRRDITLSFSSRWTIEGNQDFVFEAKNFSHNHPRRTRFQRTELSHYQRYTCRFCGEAELLALFARNVCAISPAPVYLSAAEQLSTANSQTIVPT